MIDTAGKSDSSVSDTMGRRRHSRSTDIGTIPAPVETALLWDPEERTYVDALRCGPARRSRLQTPKNNRGI